MSFEPVNIEFLINSETVKAESDKIKQQLMQIGFSAEEAEKKINGKLQGALTNQALKTLPLLEQQGVRTKRVWNGLGNSINQLSREIPAFAVNAQTGFLAISNNLPILADEIQRLKLKNDDLVASGKKGIPVWKQVLKGMLSWQTALSLGVALLTIYGAKIVKWVGAVLKGKGAIDKLKLSQKALNETFKSTKYGKVIRELLELKSLMKLAKDGVIKKDVALKKYNDTLGDVVGKTNDLNVADKNIIDKAPAYAKAMLYRTAATIAAAEAAKKLVEKHEEIAGFNKNIADAEKAKEAALKKGISSSANAQGQFTNLGANSADYNIASNKEKIVKAKKELEKNSKDALDIVAEFNKKAADIAAEAGLNIFDTDTDKNKSKKVDQYQNLLDKLHAIDQEYSRKSFTKDKEEIQALKDKFAKIRTLVERYNSDPKNKAKIIDLAGFNSLEKSATTELAFRQETTHLKDELTERKKLYQEFEAYKKTFGTASAEKEYAGKIGEAKTYYEYLKALAKKNASAFTAVKNKTATGGQVTRVDLLNDGLKEAKNEQQKIFNEQLADLLSYQKKRAVLIDNYNVLVNNLLDEGRQNQIANATKLHKEDLDALADTHIKKLQAYKALQRGIVDISKKQAKIVIANAKALLNRTDISEDLKYRLEKQIKDLEKSINQKAIDTIYKYTRNLGAFADTLEELGDVLGSSDVRNAGAFLSGIAGGLDNFFTALDAESKEEKIAAGINAAISLISVFTSAAAKRKAAEEEYYLNVIGFQNQYNLGLAEQKRLQSELSENVFLTDYVGRIQDGVSAIGIANDGLSDALDNLRQKGQVKTGQRTAVDWGNVGTATAAGAALGSVIPVIGTVVGAIAGFIGGLFGGGKKKDNFGDILREYPELIERSSTGMETVNVKLAESLIANKLVKGETAEILQNILDWQTALEEARAQINEVISELAGGLGNDLRTVLVDAFVAGEDAAIKMGDTVEKVLEDVLSNFIFNQVFQQAFDDLQEQMAASFDVGGDSNWTDDFSRFFTSASALTDDFNEAMEAAQAEASALGFSIFDNAESQTALNGGIRRELTEETGSELLGLFRGFYDLTKFNNENITAFLEVEKTHYNTTLEILAMNTLIEANTREMVLQIIKSNKYLESIDETSTDHYLFIQ